MFMIRGTESFAQTCLQCHRRRINVADRERLSQDIWDTTILRWVYQSSSMRSQSNRPGRSCQAGTDGQFLTNESAAFAARFDPPRDSSALSAQLDQTRLAQVQISLS